MTASFTKKEIAFLIDALDGIIPSNKKTLKCLSFKLWRLFNLMNEKESKLLKMKNHGL